VHFALSIVTVSLGQFLMPRVANVLLVHYTTIGSPSYFSATKVRFVALGFITFIQVKANLCYIVIVFLFSKRKICLILVSFLTIS
jgi:hypothetical protein